MSDLIKEARRAIALLDLTNLDDDCSKADIDELCRRARTPYGAVAAVCIWPNWVKRARKKLKGSKIKIAAVVNFPKGRKNAKRAVEETEEALDAGAHEIDMVIPYRQILRGHIGAAAKVVAGCRAATPKKRILKVILETGELRTRGHILLAAQIALDEGADFIKTSTGKASVNATPFAAEIMLGAIARGGYRAGFKAAGGIRTTADAAAYLALADRIMGAGWATPKTFRFGASGVLAGLIATIDGRKAVGARGY